MQYWFKECPRCHGDLREEKDYHGLYICCLQCGHILNASESAALYHGSAAERTPLTLAGQAA